MDLEASLGLIGKSQFVARDQISTLLVINCWLFIHRSRKVVRVVFIVLISKF